MDKHLTSSCIIYQVYKKLNSIIFIIFNVEFADFYWITLSIFRRDTGFVPLCGGVQSTLRTRSNNWHLTIQLGVKKALWSCLTHVYLLCHFVPWPNLSTLGSLPEQASNSRPESADASSVWYFTSLRCKQRWTTCLATSWDMMHGVVCIPWSRLCSHYFLCIILPRCTATSLEGAQAHNILGRHEFEQPVEPNF